MNTGVREKVVLITGAGSGIGRAAAVLAAGTSAAGLVLNDLDPDNLEATAAEARSHDVEVHTFAGDIAASEVPAALVELAVAEFGRLDAAFNNAGTRGGIQPLTEVSDEEWQQVLDLNLTSVFRCVRAQLAHMMTQRSGAIVNTASATVHRSPAQMSAFAASKTGLLGLSKVAALEGGPHGVHVNALCPGRTDTPMLGASDPDLAAVLLDGIPVGHFGRPDEVAAALWLLSDAAGFVNGTTLTVDGGRSAG